MDIQPITKYGVTLRPLTHDKIEMVRQWRNDPKIQQYMEYREEITPEMQEKWFQKISTSGRDFYFIIEVEGKEIGLINVKDVDFNKKEGEPGIFIWDDIYIETDVPMRASFCFLYFVWEILKLEKLIAHVLSDNPRAIRMNKGLGYSICDDQDCIYNQKYTLFRESFYRKNEKIIKYLDKTY